MNDQPYCCQREYITTFGIRIYPRAHKPVAVPAMCRAKTWEDFIFVQKHEMKRKPGVLRDYRLFAQSPAVHYLCVTNVRTNAKKSCTTKKFYSVN